ncbi:MAG: hypothetical protein Q7Q73_06780 [Verrucomicrobiota bacterium JB024]|nr:hypothetical protein [Verrucomicrobiota bacterium JB024]
MNILFITDDQHRYDFFDCYGRFPVKTPALRHLSLIDRLSRIHTPNTDDGPFPKEVWYTSSYIHPSMSEPS